MFKKKNDKFAIVGYAPGRSETPFEDETFDIALMNDLHFRDNWPARDRPRIRFDVLFDMHHPEVMKKFSRAGLEHWNFLRETKIPVITLAVIPEVPSSEAYPISEILEAFDSKYFTSTVSYQLAWALYQGYKEVHVYGVNFIGKEEYEYQRASAEYWIGLLRGAGVKVYIPDTSCLMKAGFMYGYETHVLNKNVGENLTSILRAKVTEIKGAHGSQTRDLMKSEGQLDALNWFVDVYGHVARGGYLPPPENVAPETAYAQQRNDRRVQAMNHFKSVSAEAIANPSQVNATRLEAACAAMLGLEDDLGVLKRIDEG